MALVRERLAAGGSRLPELWIEDKGSALALHYRRAPRLQAAVRALAEQALDGIADAQLLPGDQVLEIRAPGQDKGKALAYFMDRSPFAGRRAVALGDDHTDEDAFVAAQARGGCGVVVGTRRPTAARCALEGPESVRRWLQHSLERAAAVSA
jgi:trehalose 6-phosphate phosphatase